MVKSMKQLIIGICDDQPEVLEALQKLLDEICEEKGISREIVAFTDGNELLEHIKEIQVAFLDIEMPQLDGIELGKKIKERNPKCKVIMATGMVERFKEAFQIQALRFVTKPFSKEEVREALEAAVEGISFSKNIEVYAERNKYEIPEEEIEFIKAYNGYSEFCVGEKYFRKECSLKELEEILNEHLFVRINRDVIVNMSFVEDYDGARVVGEVNAFHISRRRRKEFERKYMEFDLKYRRLLGR